jgi:hypothetical protein
MIKVNLDFLAGACVGFGAGYFSREVTPAADTIKPLAKSAIRSGIIAYERAAVGLARLRETIEDITAEARAEAQHPAPAVEKPSGWEREAV